MLKKDPDIDLNLEYLENKFTFCLLIGNKSLSIFLNESNQDFEGIT